MVWFAESMMGMTRAPCSATRLFYACSSSLGRSFCSPAHPLYLRNSLNGAEVFVVGTCHASPQNAITVKELELCPARALHLRSGKSETIEPTYLANLPGDLGHLFREVLFDVLGSGLSLGQEFKVALQEGEKVGAEFHYIDEAQDVTMGRIVKDLSPSLANLPQLAKKFPAFFYHENGREFIKALKKENAMQEFVSNFPGMKALIHNRDELMTQRLRKLEGKIVAIVGSAHVEGMQKLWQNAEP